ncbi:MAG TPA: FAD binding domain-containing protein [Candidatus Limnocylindrales bacterium]|nr:FAD binding domain-containing protein [Candidatus Limnocylindrales bacterium]
MIPRFALVRARSLDEAFEAYAAADGDVAWIAGGTELLQVMKMGLASFATLIDLKPIAELHGLDTGPQGELRIGAATTHREVERSSLVAERVPALTALEGHVANVRVRNQGTLGGNLSFAEPHSDPATFLLACDASVELAGPGGRRRLPVDAFVVGPLTTDRAPDEVLVRVDVPSASGTTGRGYAKIAFFERPAVSVGVQVSIAGGAVSEARVAVGSLVDAPALVPQAAQALVGIPAAAADAPELKAELAAAAGRAMDAFASLDIIEDLSGSADYKRHLAGVLLQRATRQALADGVARG